MTSLLNFDDNVLSKHTIKLINKYTSSKTITNEDQTELAQYFTPTVVADFMSSLFDSSKDDITLLDPGAGTGALSISFINAFKNSNIAVTAWEKDGKLIKDLEKNLCNFVSHSTVAINNSDFILDSVRLIQSCGINKYSHIIMNPPYKKMPNTSEHKKQLSTIGVDTVNLYSAFLMLSIIQADTLGQIVAIIPRSFCNGPYYKSLRQLILSNCSIDRIHLFKSRDKVFSTDGVLQENIIIKLVKNKPQGLVNISHSVDQNFSNLKTALIDFDNIVKSNDSDYFIHIPTDNNFIANPLFSHTLAELPFSVSTGSIVDFRLKDNWSYALNGNCVPLIYPHNFVKGSFCYPIINKKPSALIINKNIEKWLLPNSYYVLVKRFSTKEEKKRIVAYLYDSELINSEFICFENHWNVIHFNKQGLDKTLAKGICCFLNSSIVDEHFRSFSGHTQVNATDLKKINYPKLEVLIWLGERYSLNLTQIEIDYLIKDSEVFYG